MLWIIKKQSQHTFFSSSFVYQQKNNFSLVNFGRSVTIFNQSVSNLGQNRLACTPTNIRKPDKVTRRMSWEECDGLFLQPRQEKWFPVRRTSTIWDRETGFISHQRLPSWQLEAYPVHIDGDHFRSEFLHFCARGTFKRNTIARVLNFNWIHVRKRQFDCLGLL